VQQFKQHVSNLVGNELSSYEYFMAWLGHILQFPGSSIGKGVALSGPPGCGRGMLKSLMIQLLSRKLKNNPSYQYAGNGLNNVVSDWFDSSRTHKLLVTMDEFKINSNKIEETKNKLKQCFDQSDFDANPKYGRIEKHWNYNNFLFLLNAVNSITIDDKDRMIVLFSAVNNFSDCSECPGVWQPFDACAKATDRSDADTVQKLHALAVCLMKYSKSYQWLQTNMPQTEAMEGEQEKNAEPIEHFFKFIAEQKVVEEGVQGTQTCSSEHLLRYRWVFKQAAAQHGFVGEKMRECVDRYCSNSFKTPYSTHRSTRS
jgi:hypothetical protein